MRREEVPIVYACFCEGATVQRGRDGVVFVEDEPRVRAEVERDLSVLVDRMLQGADCEGGREVVVTEGAGDFGVGVGGRQAVRYIHCN